MRRMKRLPRHPQSLWMKDSLPFQPLCCGARMLIWHLHARLSFSISHHSMLRGFIRQRRYTVQPRLALTHMLDLLYRLIGASSLATTQPCFPMPSSTLAWKNGNNFFFLQLRLGGGPCPLGPK